MRSESAKLLAKELGITRIRKYGSTYYPRVGDTIINWGRIKDLSPALVINSWQGIRNCTDKIRFFGVCSADTNGPRIPEYTTNREYAHRMHATGVNLVVRDLVSSSGGRGAWILNARPGLNLAAFPRAPLFTRLIEDVTEFRVHVMDDLIVWRQQKLRKNGVSKDSLIRNHDNGWVFSSNLRFWEEDIGIQARKAVKTCGLDFGAVDMLWSHSERKAYALEVNSAPGIEGGSLAAYAVAFKERLNITK